MSIKAINYVIDLELGDPTSKLIMINLANLYNDATEFAYPSHNYWLRDQNVLLELFRGNWKI